jgi:SMODS-associated NUDIX domain
MKYILQIITAAILIVVGKYFVSDELRPEFIGGGLTLFISFLIIEAGYDIYENYRRITLVLKCKWLAHKRQYIRFSMSYQYRIIINDEYLLVKNSNWNFYQHVGGKYKRLPVTQKILKDLGATDDLKLKTTGLMKDDLAVFIPASNAIKFIDWFDSRRERDLSLERIL